MDVELQEVRDFLGSHLPFEGLPVEELTRLTRGVTIRYLRRGADFPPDTGGVPHLHLLRQGAVEQVDAEGRCVAKFAEGDFFDAECSKVGGSSSRARVVEGCLVYSVACELVEQLGANYPSVMRCFVQSLRERWSQALSELEASPVGDGAFFSLRVGELVTRPAVSAVPELSIREAAQLMSREGISALPVVAQGALQGIVTDRDLRQRCLAAGLPDSRPIEEIMSREVVSIDAHELAFDAWLTLARSNIHHLPVLHQGQLIGLVTTTDLVRYQSTTAVHLVNQIHKAQSIDELRESGRGLPRLAARLGRAGASARQVGLALSTVGDALTTRLLTLYQEQRGPAPAAFAWVACGSQGRQELSARSDQDHALILANDLTVEQPLYFEELAHYVGAGLEQCGLELCPGGAMATNLRWRQSVDVWIQTFDDWLQHPDAEAVLHGSIFFDMRLVAGNSELLEQTRAHFMHRLKEEPVILARLARNAVGHVPPLGFFRNLVVAHSGEHAHTLDLKRGGLQPIVELARIYALACGSTSVNTSTRLRAAADTTWLSREGAEELSYAWELLASLRQRHHVERARCAEPMDDCIDPSTLAPLFRRHLKEAFLVIRRMQDVLAQRFQVRQMI